MPPYDKPFNELLLETAELDKSGLIFAILENAKKGDSSALRMLEKAFANASAVDEEKVKITPDQYRQIIKLAAERL